MPLNEIKPTDIRRWQNELSASRGKDGKPYSQTYLRCINNQLTAIFNYAVKYYGLKENPCHKAGGMGKKKADEMLFWTKDEFNAFIPTVADKPASYAIFMTLYYTGIREGELLAENRDGSLTIPCDSVALSLGVRPNAALAARFHDVCSEVYIVGDCREVGNITSAVREGFYAAMNI